MTADLNNWQRNATARYDDDGREIVDVVTCGTCGRSWNDALISSRTPVPAGRCPFESLHEDEDDIRGSRFSVGITLEIVAGNEQLAIETARKAGRSLESPAIVHGWVNREATPLFDDTAFKQIRGQMVVSS